MALSYSQLSSFRSCPRKYEFAFVKKLPQPMTEANAFGISVHSALAKFGRAERVESGKRTHLRQGYGGQVVDSDQSSLFDEDNVIVNKGHSLEDLLEIWGESFTHNVYENKAAADFDRSRGEKLMKKFYEWWGREERKVVGVEKGFRIRIEDERNEKRRGGEEITGRFDRVEEFDGGLRIIDYKTTMPRSQEEVDQDMQLSIYAIAAKETLKKEVKELVMLYLHEENLTQVITTRSDSELATVANNIQLLAERIDSKDYSPTPSSGKCRKCSYRRVCDASASL